MVPVFDAAVNVSVAWIDAPAFKTVFYRFQDNVREESAPVGVQLLSVRVNICPTLPVYHVQIAGVGNWAMGTNQPSKTHSLKNQHRIRK
jgi:hypothetical protein